MRGRSTEIRLDEMGTTEKPKQVQTSRDQEVLRMIKIPGERPMRERLDRVPLPLDLK